MCQRAACKAYRAEHTDETFKTLPKKRARGAIAAAHGGCRAALTQGDDSDEDTDSGNETTDDETDPDMYRVGDTVRVWWEEENAWFKGEVEKINTKTVVIYYPAEGDGDDSFSTHWKHIWTIEKLASVGENRGKEERGDKSDSDE